MFKSWGAVALLAAAIVTGTALSAQAGGCNDVPFGTKAWWACQASGGR